MDPVTIGLIATSALGKLGSIVGQKKRKQLDPALLQRLFGAKQITDEQMELFNRAMASPQGQKLMTGAAQEGQQFQTDIARRSAEAGLGPAGGATGGADIFAGAASEQAASELQRGTQANMMQAMLPVAQQLVQSRMQAWLNDREGVLGQTSRFQDISGAIGGLSSDLLAAKAGGDASKAAPVSPYASDQLIGPPAPAPVPQQMTAQPSGAMGAKPSNASNAPAGAQPVITPPSQLGMQDSFIRPRRPSLGGGRFARAMGAGRFGAVQPSYGGQ